VCWFDSSPGHRENKKALTVLTFKAFYFFSGLSTDESEVRSAFLQNPLQVLTPMQFLAANNMPIRELLGILSLLFALNNLSAQSEYGCNNPESIKILKVKTLCVYHYNTKLDSILTSESKFDMSGSLTVHLSYSGKGNLVSKDTFSYNSKGLLLNKTSFDNQSIKSTSLFEYDSIGRLLKQVTKEDSASYTSSIIYDKDGRRSTTILYLNFNKVSTDTMIYNSFFNKKGQLIKLVAFSRSACTPTITTTAYNRTGKVTKRKIDSPESSSSSFAKHTMDGEIFQTTITNKSDGRVIKSELQSSYYPNGLIFQRLFFSNNKAISVERIYYTFY
jgi:antitoxin component YwqK of YwqJK toxin-antitoxin module